jgi:hypothetical protein
MNTQRTELRDRYTMRIPALDHSMQVAARDVELCVQLQGELNTLIQQMDDLE